MNIIYFFFLAYNLYMSKSYTYAKSRKTIKKHSSLMKKFLRQ